MNASSNPSLHRTPASLLSSLQRGARPAPVSSKPLGTRRLGGAIVLALAIATACHDKTPTQPQAESLTGTWTGGLTQTFPCLGDWHTVKLTLEQSGESVTGTGETKDGLIFEVSGPVTNGSGRLTVSLPINSGDCPVMGIGITSVSRTSFSSQVGGRCCGTIDETVQFVRSAGAFYDAAAVKPPDR